MIALCDLVPRRDRANAMSRRRRQALAGHIARTGWYPALIVRPHPTKACKYEILDGCQRAEALRGQGLARARCEVWPADDEAALILAGTLNQLRGRASAIRRARRTRRIARVLGPAAAIAAMGITPAALHQQLALLRRPKPAHDPRPIDLKPLVFHVPAENAALVEQTLRAFTRSGDRRGDALIRALRSASPQGDGTFAKRPSRT